MYAVKIDIDEHFFEGMMYIGKRPTVTNQPDINIEINIFDFNQNIYDKFITIQILKFLRQDIKFKNLEELKEQLKVDEKMPFWLWMKLTSLPKSSKNYNSCTKL